MITNFLLALLTIGFGVVIFLLLKQKKSPDDAAAAEITRLKAELESEKSKKDELSGKNKQLYAETVSLKADQKILAKERDSLKTELAEFRAEESRRKKESDEKIEKLNSAEKALEDEKKRIRREDEEKQQKEKEERDRMWAEHERKVIFYLTELCKKPEYDFQIYDNKNLPDGFDGRLKPDFMIEFLGQFIIFDAKVSRSDNLQTYISNSVKNTAGKIKNNAKIYPAVFFVVPTEAIGSLKKTYFYEQGYAFYVVSPEALAPILSSLKKVSNYEFAEQMDPQDRENIVALIAEFDHHLSSRNAVDLLLAQSGLRVLDKTKMLNPDIREEVAMKKKTMRPFNLHPSELKSLASDAQNQQDRIHQLIAPKAPISDESIDSAKSLLDGRKKKARK